MARSSPMAPRRHSSRSPRLEPTERNTLVTWLREPEHVLHGIEPRRRRPDEARRAQRAAREGVPAVRAVGELQPLAQRSEGHGVLADDVARAEREHADLRARAFPGKPMPAVYGRLGQIAP